MRQNGVTRIQWNVEKIFPKVCIRPRPFFVAPENSYSFVTEQNVEPASQYYCSSYDNIHIHMIEKYALVTMPI